MANKYATLFHEVEQECKECGARFVPEWRKQRSFCSIECRHRFWNRYTHKRVMAKRHAGGPKKCGVCEKNVPSYRNRFCDDCAAARIKASTLASYARAIADPEKYKKRLANTAKWRKANIERIRAKKRSQKYRAKDRERETRLKIECWKAYGGDWCAYCGSKKKLHLHHPNGDGGEHRRELKQEKGGHKWYAALKRLGFPTDRKLIVLCERCHNGKKPEAAKSGFVPSDWMLLVG